MFKNFSSLQSIKHLFQRSLRYGFISLFILILLDIYTWNISEAFHYIFVFILGATIGFFHNLVLGKPLAKLPLPIMFIIEFIFINILTFDLLILYFYITGGPEIWSSWSTIKQTLTGPYYTSLIMDVIVTSSVILFYIKIEQLLGDRLFIRYIFGRYAHPKKEERVFMFIDLKDSTTIAEKLDAFQYYEFINECFRLMSNPALRTQAEILKYIGDEVIFTWKPQKGLRKANCIRLFYSIQAALSKKSKTFEQKYGIKPEYILVTWSVLKLVI